MPRPGSAPSGALLLACAFACGVAVAQPALLPSAAASAAERAQKESDRTMYWIRVLATTPAPVKAAPATKPAAVAAPAAARPPTEAREKIKPASAQAPATAAAPPPGPVAVAHASNLAQAPVGDAPEPSALSSRTADRNAAAVANPDAPAQRDVAPDPEPDPGLIQVKSVQPEFPTSVVERIHRGHVEVRFEVEPGGSVVDADVVESSNSHLNNAAVDAIKQWRFKPTHASHTALVNLVFDIDKAN